MKFNDWLEFTLLVGCRLGCKYCPQGKIVSRYRELYPYHPLHMDGQTFEAILDHVPLDKVGIHFSGMADACLHPDFLSFFAHAHKRGAELALFTTFQGLSHADFQTLCSFPFALCSVHLPDANNLSRFDWTEDYIAILGDLAKGKLQCERLDKMCMVGPPALDAMVQALQPIRTMQVQLHANNVEWEGKKTPTSNVPLKCGRGANLRQNIVFPNGEVFCCCADQGLQMRLGNLLTNTFDELDEHRDFYIRSQRSNTGPSILPCKYCEFAVPL